MPLTRIGNDELTVEISSLGSEMQTLQTRDGRAWLWHGDAAFWSGRSPVLFPIVGKAADDTVVVDGRPYPMGQHGFARRSEFALLASSPVMCRYQLEASEKTKDVYPFDFALVVEHAVEGRSLTVAAEVSNRDTVDMPFGLGFHTAFAWPLPGADNKAHSIALDNDAEPALARLEAGLLRPDRLPSPFVAGQLLLDHEMFAHDAMIFPEGAGAGLRYGVKGGPSMHFHFENLPNLALWTKPGAPFLCIEPWHGMAAELGGSSEIAARPGSTVLAPGQTARFAFTVEIGR